jgi:hypothetical protein
MVSRGMCGYCFTMALNVAKLVVALVALTVHMPCLSTQTPTEHLEERPNGPPVVRLALCFVGALNRPIALSGRGLGLGARHPVVPRLIAVLGLRHCML